MVVLLKPHHNLGIQTHLKQHPKTNGNTIADITTITTTTTDLTKLQAMDLRAEMQSQMTSINNTFVEALSIVNDAFIGIEKAVYNVDKCCQDMRSQFQKLLSVPPWYLTILKICLRNERI